MQFVVPVKSIDSGSNVVFCRCIARERIDLLGRICLDLGY